MDSSPAGSFWKTCLRLPSPTFGEVQLFWVTLDDFRPLLDSLRALLADDERAKADRYYFEKDRVHYTVARGLLRVLLAEQLERPPRSLAFSYGERGKPSLQGIRHFFNVSHSNGAALLAFSPDRELGVDLEGNRTISDLGMMARHSFSPREQSVFFALPEAQKLEGFLNAWSRKEAFIKAVGEGLFRGLSSFDVSLRPGEPARLLWSQKGGDVERWTLVDLPPLDARYRSALCVEAPLPTLSAWVLEPSLVEPLLQK